MEQREDSRGLVALILGIASFFTVPLILGIAAWVIGSQALQAGTLTEQQRQMAVAGRVLGIVNIALCAVGFAIGFLIFAGMLTLGAFLGGLG